MAKSRKKKIQRNRKIQSEYNAERSKNKITPDQIFKKLEKKWFLEISTLEKIVYGNWSEE